MIWSLQIAKKCVTLSIVLSVSIAGAASIDEAPVDESVICVTEDQKTTLLFSQTKNNEFKVSEYQIVDPKIFPSIVRNSSGSAGELTLGFLQTLDLVIKAQTQYAQELGKFMNDSHLSDMPEPSYLENAARLNRSNPEKCYTFLSDHSLYALVCSEGPQTSFDHTLLKTPQGTFSYSRMKRENSSSNQAKLFVDRVIYDSLTCAPKRQIEKQNLIKSAKSN